MGISATSISDAEITTALAQAESFIAEVLDRRLEDSGSDVTDTLDGSGFDTIRVKAWPINAVTSVSYLSNVASGAGTYTAFDAGSYIHDATDGRFIRKGYVDYGFDPEGEAVWPFGVQNIQVVYQGGYTSGSVPDKFVRCIYEVASRLLQTRSGNTEDIRGDGDDLRGYVLSVLGSERRQAV